MYCLSKSLVYGIYRDYQKGRTYALRGSPPINGTLMCPQTVGRTNPIDMCTKTLKIADKQIQIHQTVML